MVEIGETEEPCTKSYYSGSISKSQSEAVCPAKLSVIYRTREGINQSVKGDRFGWFILKGLTSKVKNFSKQLSDNVISCC